MRFPWHRRTEDDVHGLEIDQRPDGSYRIDHPEDHRPIDLRVGRVEFGPSPKPGQGLEAKKDYIIGAGAVTVAQMERAIEKALDEALGPMTNFGLRRQVVQEIFDRLKTVELKLAARSKRKRKKA